MRGQQAPKLSRIEQPGREDQVGRGIEPPRCSRLVDQFRGTQPESPSGPDRGEAEPSPVRPGMPFNRPTNGSMGTSVPWLESENFRTDLLHAPSLVHWKAMRNIPSNMPPPDRTGDTPEIMAPLCSVFRRFLKSKNLKYTPERAEVLDAIIARDGVFEVEELLLEMQGNGHRISKATIYRTINLLVDAGIITQALFDSKQAHYRLIYGQEPHDHMLCMRTGKLIEFTNPELSALRDRICRELGWEPVGHRFQIYALSPAPVEEDPEHTEQSE